MHLVHSAAHQEIVQVIRLVRFVIEHVGQHLSLQHKLKYGRHAVWGDGQGEAEKRDQTIPALPRTVNIKRNLSKITDTYLKRDSALTQVEKTMKLKT